MSGDDVAEKVTVMGCNLGRYIEKNQGLLPCEESLTIAMSAIMKELKYDSELEKVQALNAAILSCLEEE